MAIFRAWFQAEILSFEPAGRLQVDGGWKSVYSKYFAKSDIIKRVILPMIDLQKYPNSDDFRPHLSIFELSPLSTRGNLNANLRNSNVDAL